MASSEDDVTTAMSTTLRALAGSLSLQNSIAGLTTYDGSNVPLKDFLQDIKNGDEQVGGGQKASYLRAVLGKLKGPAKDCTYGRTFNTIEELCRHLKHRFAPGKGFTYYSSKFHTLRMLPDDSIGGFHDKICILLECARSALREEKGAAYSENMMTIMVDGTVDIFIRGLPGDLGQLVDMTKPKSLDEAYKEAVRLESRMDARIIPDSRGYRKRPYGERISHDGQTLNYHGARPNTTGASQNEWSDISDPATAVTM